MLEFKALSLAYSAEPLFENASFTLNRGMKVGLVGLNGAGKTSIFRALLGELSPVAGDIVSQKNITIATMTQDVEGTDNSALDYVMSGDTPNYKLIKDLDAAEAAGDDEAMMKCHMAMAESDAYTLESRAAKIMTGLGVAHELHGNPVSSFSGGWRMRLNIGRALIGHSDLLLLDEPTNHLDIETIEWLIKWLRSYQGLLIVISHDRDFLDEVTTTTVCIEHQKVKLYRGNYSAFEVQRAEHMAFQAAMVKKQQTRIAHMMSYVERFRAKASKAKQAQSRLKAIGRLEEIAAVQVDNPFNFEFYEADGAPSPMVRTWRMSTGYGDKKVLQRVNVNIEPGARVGLVGKNGAGKSTLIKTLCGKLKSITGEVTIHPATKIGYFDQHNIDALDLSKNPVELIKEARDADVRTVRAFLGGFAISDDMALNPIAPLSGGEKTRVALALIVWQKPNLLVLDEPTNHLDLRMREALAIALQSFNGAVVIVSHDKHLLKTTADDLLLIKDGLVGPFDGDVDEYLKGAA